MHVVISTAHNKLELVNEPAQISKGLEIQFLHLLLAEPVADSPAFQESLHFHCAPGPFFCR